MAATQAFSLNLNLGVLPEIDAKKDGQLFNELSKIRGAIRNVAAALDSYTGNTGTGNVSATAGRVAVGNGVGWGSFSGFTYDGVSTIFTVPKVVTAQLSLATPAAAYTKTYSTASRVIPNATATVLATTAATNIAPYGYTTAAQANDIAVQVNALAADVLILKQLIVALVNDTSRTLGIGINAT
jgi:hypothetical protein